MKIKIKYINKDLQKLTINKKGDWIDLRYAGEAYKSKKGNDLVLFPLGIAMKLPKYYEAIAVPRSSSFKNFGFIQANSVGVIDNTYCGDKDQWMFPAIFLKSGSVEFNDRICQFRIQLTQFAPWYAKLKWIFCKKIKFIEVESLSGVDRGGFGSSGIK